MISTFACATLAVTLVCLAASSAMAQLANLPDGCPALNASASVMPGQLAGDSAYLDFVQAETGQRTQLLYEYPGLAAELIRSSPAGATYRLYHHSLGQEVSVMTNWPLGPCNSSNATNNASSLGLALTEIRDTALVNRSSPCLLMLLSPDLADAHNHSLRSLAWTVNGTACFSGNDTIIGAVWRVSISLARDNATVTSVVFELLSPTLVVNTSTVWQTMQRRTFNFFASQKYSSQPAEAIAQLRNPPPFIACGSAREQFGRPPQLPQNMLFNVRLGLDDDVVTVQDDLASARTLTPATGETRLNNLYGPSRLRLVADRDLAGVTFVIGLEAGNNCTVDGNNSLASLLPFDLSLNNSWLWTGEQVHFQSRSDCSRFLQLANSTNVPDYEVYFCGGKALNFSDLTGFTSRRRNGNNTEVTTRRVTQIGLATAEPMDYDLTACALTPNGGGAMRLLMRLEATYDQLIALSPAKLTASVRSAVATSVPGVSRLRVAQVSVAKDANASLSQVWLTLMGPPVGARSTNGSWAPSLSATWTALAGAKLKLLNSNVASLEDAQNATDPAGRGGGGGGGGSGTVYIHDGHSGGAMAALAFFMLLLGGCGGVLGAWCVWKRRPNMPYYVQD